MSAEYVPLEGYETLSEAEMQARAEAVFDTLRKRRTIRDFSDKAVPRELIETCIKAAGTAPSGATISLGILWRYQTLIQNVKFVLPRKQKKRNFTISAPLKNGSPH